MADKIIVGDRVSWRFSPQPRQFGTVLGMIRPGRSLKVIGYRVRPDDGPEIRLASRHITKECD
jgi:hypothetical protein